VGPNGAGKTTLIRMVLGEELPSTGAIRVGSSIVPGYYAQEHETVDPAMTPLDMVRRLKPLNEQQALSALVAFKFDRTSATTRIGALSGGERSRLQIAALILTGANFLVLDEPTNNLDIASTEALEAALLDFEGTIMTISHDRYYLDRMCTRVLEVRDGLVISHSGGFTSFMNDGDKSTVITRQERMPVAAGQARRR
jgi:ATP-binding cassette subfamily F protein 3